MGTWYKSLGAICLGAGLLTSCVPLVVGGITSCVVVSAKKKGFSGVMSDTMVRSRIRNAWMASDKPIYRQVSLTFDQGVALLTGWVTDKATAQEAETLTAQIPGVTAVHNHIFVSPHRATNESQIVDLGISNRLRLYMTTDNAIAARNYTIRTFQRTIYILGYAPSTTELERVLFHAQSIPRACRVVHYVLTP